MDAQTARYHADGFTIARTARDPRLIDLATLRKFHISLNVSSPDGSIAFYRALFGTEPAKARSDYAKFDLAEPPLVLSLIPGRPSSSGHLNHAGLRVRTADELIEIQRRLEAAGITTRREEGVECCYARQTKFWVTDPDRALWEIYVFHEDGERRCRGGAGAGGIRGRALRDVVADGLLHGG